MKPVRLQLSRKKGFNLQSLSMATNGLPAVNVARPSKWGNPFGNWMGAGEDEFGRAYEARLFRELIDGWQEQAWFLRLAGPKNATLANHKVAKLRELRKAMIFDRHELAGKNLACFCKLDQPCHADILLALANGEGG